MANTTTTFDNSAYARAYARSRHGLGLLAGVRKAFLDYRLYRRTLAELENLSDRELRDLGLSRLAIRGVAYDSVYGA